MKNLLITGASSGLGLHLSRHFSENGFKIFAVSRTSSNLDGISNLIHLPFDLSDNNHIKECSNESAKLKLDGIIHALGGGFGMKSPSLTHSELDLLFKLNFSSAFLINDSVIAAHDSRKTLNILHFDSVATSEITASLGYTLTKSLLRPYVKHLARTILCKNIFISNIQLGGIVGFGGSMDRLRFRDEGVYDEFIRRRRPSGRLTPVEELTNYVAILLTDAGRLHSGNTLTLDESELSSL